MNLDYSRDKLLSEFGIITLRDRYMLPEEKSPQDAFARAAKAFADDDAHAQRLYDYASKLWFMFSTPILSNGGTGRGMPISCFLNYVGDSRKEITSHYTEDAFLSSVGGGIGTYWGAVRSAGKKSTGIIPFIKVSDAEMLAFTQGDTRRGSSAVYIDIDHPEIEEFLDIRKPTGDANRNSTNINHGVNITDKFMRIIKEAAQAKERGESYDDSWDLIDPKSKLVVKTVPAKALWIKIINNRVETGEPYITFIDTIQKALPEWQKNLGLQVHHSNLCTEITLATAEDRTAVCCLSSVNVEEYDQWKHDPAFIPDIVRMLDNVLQHFIDHAPNELWRAVYSAERERSIGLGAMGLHAYFQRHNIAFESGFARHRNIEIFQHLREEALRADAILCAERGECPDAEGFGRRFSHLLAIAPNATSSIYCGNTSPSVEPYPANAYIQKTLSGSGLQKNEYLQLALQELNMDIDKVWKDIATTNGSVQHLDFLSEHTKAVFRTAREIDQKWVILLASDRQKELCQAQSINLYYTSNVSKRELHNHHVMAWELGMKSLYYLRSEAAKKAEKLSEVTIRETIFTNTDCVACEG